MSDLSTLVELLESRIGVISDHHLRDEDPDEQLRQLREVSESIMALHQQLAPSLKPKLAHFMENCSYDKALAHLKENPEG